MRKPTSNEDLTQRFRNSPEKKHGMKNAREQVRSFKRNIAHSIYFMLYTIVIPIMLNYVTTLNVRILFSISTH